MTFLILVASSGQIASAQSMWKWPEKLRQRSEAPISADSAWASVPPAGESASSGLIGPSDFGAASFAELVPEAKADAASQTSSRTSAIGQTPIQWQGLPTDSARQSASATPAAAAGNVSGINLDSVPNAFSWDALAKSDTSQNTAKRSPVAQPPTSPASDAQPASGSSRLYAKQPTASVPWTPPAEQAIRSAPSPSDRPEKVAAKTPQVPSLPPTQLLPFPEVASGPAPVIGKLQEDASTSLIPESLQVLTLHNLATPSDKPFVPPPQSDSIIPLDILPIRKLISADSPGSAGPYSVAEIDAPLPNASVLFTQSRTARDFRNEPGEQFSSVRTMAGTGSFGPEWSYQQFAWVTGTFYHQPLYFEQVNLERYGLGGKPIVTPLASAGHFFGSIGLLPYKLLTQHPREHVYTLGHQRPGDCVAYQRRSLIGQSYPGEALKYFDRYAGYCR